MRGRPSRGPGWFGPDVAGVDVEYAGGEIGTGAGGCGAESLPDGVVEGRLGICLHAGDEDLALLGHGRAQCVDGYLESL